MSLAGLGWVSAGRFEVETPATWRQQGRRVAIEDLGSGIKYGHALRPC